jgi:hypothetical protein
MQSNKKECAGDGKSTGRKGRKSSRRPPVDADRIVKKAIDSVKQDGYNLFHGKPDQVKGLGKEVSDGTF